ncbi:MAG: ORF6N domain-containing protein [Bryobacteraceae bacterium]
MIHSVRGRQLMLDTDLAHIYGVPTRVLNQAVRRNLDRFPDDFMIQLTLQEATDLASRSQSVILKKRGANIKHAPFGFTQEGIAMLSSILRSKRATAVNIAIMRAFVHLRFLAGSYQELSDKLNRLETKYAGHDDAIRGILKVIREALLVPTAPRRKVGFPLPKER